MMGVAHWAGVAVVVVDLRERRLLGSSGTKRTGTRRTSWRAPIAFPENWAGSSQGHSVLASKVIT